MLYPEMEAALRADDVDRYTALLSPDLTYVRHKSGDTLSRDQMAALLRRVWAPGNRRIDDLRCLYENGDILVLHMRLSFASGSREAAMVVNLKRDGRIVRTETGVSDLGCPPPPDSPGPNLKGTFACPTSSRTSSRAAPPHNTKRP